MHNINVCSIENWLFSFQGYYLVKSRELLNLSISKDFPDWTEKSVTTIQFIPNQRWSAIIIALYYSLADAYMYMK